MGEEILKSYFLRVLNNDESVLGYLLRTFLFERKVISDHS
jgi:hypothetical protein